MTIEVGFITVYPTHNKIKIRFPVDNGFVPQIKLGGNIEEQKLFSLRDLSLSLSLSLSLCPSRPDFPWTYTFIVRDPGVCHAIDYLIYVIVDKTIILYKTGN